MGAPADPRTGAMSAEQFLSWLSAQMESHQVFIETALNEQLERQESRVRVVPFNRDLTRAMCHASVTLHDTS